MAAQNYTVYHPDNLYCGKGYCDWICDWFNWFLSADADKHNLGPVVFLRSLGLPNRFTGAYISDVPSQVKGQETRTDSLISDDSYQRAYVNDPNIRIGGDRLQIYKNQALLVPLIVAYELATTPEKDWGVLHEFNGLTIDNGDNPPEPTQLKIDNVAVNINKDKMTDFRICTSIFSAIIPDVEYGRSIKDFLEVKVSPGIYQAMVEGYFVLLRFNEVGTHWIRSFATGGRELGGVYFSDLFYEVEVEEKKTLPRSSKRMPPRNARILSQTFYDKWKSGELTEVEIDQIKKILRSDSQATRWLSPDSQNQTSRDQTQILKSLKKEDPPQS
jgi:hypothetical protein